VKLFAVLPRVDGLGSGAGRRHAPSLVAPGQMGNLARFLTQHELAQDPATLCQRIAWTRAVHVDGNA